MPLDPQLLKILACPHDHADVVLQKTKKGEQLVCKKCKRTYPIKNGIPNMMPQES
jgi:uncharacterized protein YbaR (Trm112 family)